MATKISWTDETWNPTVGCARVSEGCRNCYAEHAAAMVNRTQGKASPYRDLIKLAGGTRRDPQWNGEAKFLADRLAVPLGWRKPRRVFVDSMSDLFHKDITNEQIAAVFGVMAATSQHTYQVLTKRPARMVEWFRWALQEAHEDPVADDVRDGMAFLLATCAADEMGDGTEGDQARHYDRLLDMMGVNEGVPWPLPNVWLGVSVENQAAADERIPLLLQAPAAVRFLSCEPMLGSVDLTRWAEDPCNCMVPAMEGAGQHSPGCQTFKQPWGLDWVIAGCESGPGARPCDVAWLRSLRDQCEAAGVPFFLKQAVGPGPLRIGFDAIHAGDGSHRKGGGVIELPYLDGVQHAAFPEVARG